MADFLTREEVCDPGLAFAAARVQTPLPPALFPVRGIHRSRQRGSSLEFSEHTKYVAGDDLRSLDWKVYAKSDRYFIRRYEDERLSRVTILVDASGSMAYGGGETLNGSKYHLAARLAVAIASALLRQGDAAGLCVAGGNAFLTPPRGGAAQLDAIISVLTSTMPSGKANLSDTLSELSERLTKPSTLILIGDLLDDAGETLGALASLKARGVGVRLIHLLHHDEVTLPFENSSRFTDLEGPAYLVADPEALRKAYFEEMKNFIAATARAAHGEAIPYAFARDAAEAEKNLPLIMGRTGASLK